MSATHPDMSATFAPVVVNGPSGSALAPFVRQAASSHPASLASPRPALHPGQVAPEWVPRRGYVRPDIPPRPITAPALNPAHATRGLGWGLLLSLADDWLSKQLDLYTHGLDYRGQPIPDSNAQELGQVLTAVAEACAITDAETKPMLAPQALPLRKRTQTKEPSPSKDGVKRWRIWGRSRAGKQKREA